MSRLHVAIQEMTISEAIECISNEGTIGSTITTFSEIVDALVVIRETIQEEVKKHLIDTISDRNSGERFREAIDAVKKLGILSEGNANILRDSITDLYNDNECSYSRIFSTIGKLLSYEEINSAIGKELTHIDVSSLFDAIEQFQYTRDNDDDEYI